MNLLIIDTETTGLDASVDRVIEVAGILYSVEHQTVLHQVSTLVSATDNPAERINRIPASVLPHLSSQLQSAALALLLDMAQQSDYAVAHYAEFDAQWFGTGDLPILTQNGVPLRWLCTAYDFRWPHQSRAGEALVSLALAHGIGVGSAHRALTDCQLIAMLFDRMDHLPDLIQDALRPRAIYQALVSYHDRQLAKNAGFKWNQWVPGAWANKLTEEEVLQLPFQVLKVREA